MTVKQTAVVNTARTYLAMQEGSYGYEGCAIACIRQLLALVDELDDAVREANDISIHLSRGLMRTEDKLRIAEKLLHDANSAYKEIYHDDTGKL